MSNLKDGLRAMSLIIGTLKGLPLAVFSLVLLVDFIFGSETYDYDKSWSRIVIGVILLGLGLFLTIGQITATVKNSKFGLLVFSSWLVFIDLMLILVLVVGLRNEYTAKLVDGVAVQDDRYFGLFLVLSIAIPQIMILIWTTTSNSNNLDRTYEIGQF